LEFGVWDLEFSFLRVHFLGNNKEDWEFTMNQLITPSAPDVAPVKDAAEMILQNVNRVIVGRRKPFSWFSSPFSARAMC